MLIDNFVEIRSGLQQLIFPLLAKTCPRKGGLKEVEGMVTFHMHANLRETLCFSSSCEFHGKP